MTVLAWSLVADTLRDSMALSGSWGPVALGIVVTTLAGVNLYILRSMRHDRQDTALRLAASRGRAQIAERARARALGTISAEFRTPLNAIMVFAELLTKGFVDGSPRKRAEYASSIFISGQQLLEKLDALLDQARLEAGELNLQYEEVDPKRLLDIVIRLVEPEARINGVTLELPQGPTPFVLLADSRRLKHVFATILSNAVRLTRRDGHVSVEMRGTRDGGAEIVLAHTGTGMTEDELSQALDPVAPTDGTVSRIRESSWRGLWLARSLVELHGGALTMRSAPTAGSTVAIAFPRERIVLRNVTHALAAD
ncbi:MAG: HAMP domain-containing histidine kinase [Alphaproteobacteria bacterium]|nr:HAMP domain-containing histidine kinase [Alphaproteobacteria bacterium]